MARFFIEMAYNGKNYHGWQVQPNAITVQEVMDDCLNKILREAVSIVGCGRTDTAVHASYFVAHFDSEKNEIDEQHFCYKMNRILPKDIAVYSITKVDNETHSRFTATSRRYEYHIADYKTPFNHEFSYLPYYKLDYDLMNEAAALLFNYIDFTSFSKLHTDAKTNNCKIYQAQWDKVGDKWIFSIKADRFLRNMVRAIVGTLLEVGRGKIGVKEFASIIEQKDRGKAGSSAPGNALFLVDVEYPDTLFKSKHLVQ
ncbi:tRNA pseudouridine(38-40) synthase TruA [Saccharicrinis aurantiacus]|uniref:tRNA pseudouridine(38-40) synthase TruA n=1 Tax=Saccharicrinis aurantiacus TaxID=1849719 RepID=UPI002490AFF9|nr:tRNA pseudouridine(38-40) synthase TruA [Saccharicrinis aurantiacus]